MTRAIRAGLAYVAIVFAIGFGLGMIRVLLVIPRFGAVVAVCIEAPVLLALAWWTCGALVRRFAVPDSPLARVIMGGLAFVILMAAELAMSILLLGRTPAQHWAGYKDTAAQIGLGAQILFAAFPLLRLRFDR
jgi:hypothetical protein